MNPAARKRRILKALTVVVVLGVLGIGALVASLWLEHGMEVTLPAPTGPFAVGRVIYDWTDDATRDTLAPVPGTKRELLVWIWYPAATGRTAARIDDYVPAQLRPKGDDAGGGLFKLLTRDLSRVHGHSIHDADVSPAARTYPVVIMRAGASVEVANYSALAEDLASHGYFVVGFDAPYRTRVVVFPDGRVMRRLPENNPENCLEVTGQQRDHCAERLLTAWTSDSAFVLDRLERLNAENSSSSSVSKFTGRLDMMRVGIFGHSFGGAAAAQFCHEDSRCKAGIDVDGAPHGTVIREGIACPFMFLLSDHSGEADPDSGQVRADIQSIYDHLPPDGRISIAIRGANHFLFSDDGALLKSHIVTRTLRIFGILHIDGRRQLAITAYCLHSFFDVYLKGTAASPIKISSPLYPEIEVF